MNGLSASRRLFEILDTPEPQTGREALTGDEKSVRFENVSFSYDGERTILDRFSLTVPGKGLYCPVGLSGCGKSTAAPLLPLDEPTANLDSLNEAVVLHSIREHRGERTVVLVSHRRSTLGIADSVYEMP